MTYSKVEESYKLTSKEGPDMGEDDDGEGPAPEDDDDNEATQNQIPT